MKNYCSYGMIHEYQEQNIKCWEEVDLAFQKNA